MVYLPKFTYIDPLQINHSGRQNIHYGWYGIKKCLAHHGNILDQIAIGFVASTYLPSLKLT